MADPGFPRQGANVLFGQIFRKNCMKMKEIGRWGGGGGEVHIPSVPLGSANDQSRSQEVPSPRAPGLITTGGKCFAEFILLFPM